MGCSLGLKGWTADSDSGSSINNQQPTSYPSACYSPPHSLETNHNEQHIHHNVLTANKNRNGHHQKNSHLPLAVKDLHKKIDNYHTHIGIDISHILTTNLCQFILKTDFSLASFRLNASLDYTKKQLGQMHQYDTESIMIIWKYMEKLMKVNVVRSLLMLIKCCLSPRGSCCSHSSESLTAQQTHSTDTSCLFHLQYEKTGLWSGEWN